MRTSRRVTAVKALAVVLAFSGVLGHAQTPAPASLHDTLMAKATSLYYSTARAGLRSFDCQVHPDWTRIIRSARKGAALPEDDPRLALVKTVTITLHGDLKGGSSLDWKFPEDPQKPLDDSQTSMLNQAHHGIEQSLSGLFKLWMPLINGSIAEALGEESTEISEDAQGYTLRSIDRQESVTEIFDRGLVLKQFDLESGPTSSVNLKPTFTETPQGLLPTGFLAEIRDPDTSAQTSAQRMDVTMEYQQVSGVQIPSRITMLVPNIVEMDFKLDGCVVNPR